MSVCLFVCLYPINGLVKLKSRSCTKLIGGRGDLKSYTRTEPFKSPSLPSCVWNVQSVFFVNNPNNIFLVKAMISRPAPAWEGTAVLNGEFKELKLSDYLGKYLVFFFYPLDFTFVCPTEILAFNDRIKEFKAINTEVRFLDF